jgi:hypothetical protein
MHAGVVSWVEETAIEFTTDRTGADVTFGGFMVAFHASSFIPHVSLSFFLSFFLLCPIRLFSMEVILAYLIF